MQQRSSLRGGGRGRQACDWQPFNEKRLNQARAGLFIQNMCETEHAGDYEGVGTFILESPKDLGCLYEMAPVRIVLTKVLRLFTPVSATDANYRFYSV